MKKLSLIILSSLYLHSENLNELINYSMQNQLINSVKYNIEISQNKYKSIQNSYLPNITIGTTYSNTDNETISTPKSSLISYANINYTLYDGGAKGLLYNSYESTIKSTKENLNSTKNNIALQVINHYFSYQSLLSQKKAKQKEIEQLNAQYDRLKRFLKAGITTSDEVDKIISRVQTANVILHETELSIQTILHNLQYLTEKEITITTGSTIDEPVVQTNNLRADIKALEFSMDSILKSAKAIKSKNHPIISLDNTYYNYQLDYDNTTYNNNLENQNIFKLNFSWNLYDFGKISSEYQSIYKQYQSLKSKYEYEKNKASVDLKLSIKAYEIAKLKIASALASLKAANSTYETIQSKYQNGLVDNIAYLEALSEKYNASSQLKKAEYDLEIKKANIIYHSGKNLWEYIK
ncbi:MAG: TolC family protein [Campylobacterota bacterium]|nr:TolC family protein [Campylobacterota bacterium]